MAYDPTVRNCRDALRSIVPNWASDRPNLNVLFSVMYVIALAGDMIIEVMLEGIRAPLAGRGTPTALPYIGQTRAIIRGLLETDDQYATRLATWLDFWTNAGGAEELVQSIQGFLAGAGSVYTVNLIDRNGNLVTANADGTTSKYTGVMWNWDSLAVPSRAGQWSDMWLIIGNGGIFGRWPEYTSFTDPAWKAAWGGHSLGLGYQVTRDVVDGIYAIVAQLKGAHTWLAAIIFTDQVNAPGLLNFAWAPSGQFANWSTVDGSNRQIPARISDISGHVARYWIPPTGG